MYYAKLLTNYSTRVGVVPSRHRAVHPPERRVDSRAEKHEIVLMKNVEEKKNCIHSVLTENVGVFCRHFYVLFDPTTTPRVFARELQNASINTLMNNDNNNNRQEERSEELYTVKIGFRLKEYKKKSF